MHLFFLLVTVKCIYYNYLFAHILYTDAGATWLQKCISLHLMNLLFYNFTCMDASYLLLVSTKCITNHYNYLIAHFIYECIWWNMATKCITWYDYEYRCRTAKNGAFLLLLLLTCTDTVHGCTFFLSRHGWLSCDLRSMCFSLQQN